jgi:hypothetical protein
MMNEYLVSIDIDWASDSIITDVATILIKNKVKATWFVTHDSPQLRKLSEYPELFELGLHPNFEKESTQGRSPEEVLNYLTKIVPGARSVRTHNLLQSMPLLKLMREKFNILHDVSILMPLAPQITPHRLFFDKNYDIIRVPYFWGDNLEMNAPSPNFNFADNRYHVDGIKIYSFHPIHIVLNSNDVNSYNNLKSKTDISKCSVSELDGYINKSGSGSGTFFKEIVEFLKPDQNIQALKISELASKWKSMKTND